MRWLGGPVFAVLVVHVNQDVAMQAVTSKDDQNDKIGNQQCKVESIGAVEAFKGLVEIMRLEVVPPILRSNQENTNCGQ